MVDNEKQLAYWKAGAFEDLETAKILIEKDRLLQGLFFCHLVIEKIIKAHVVKQTNDSAPRSHNLIYLSERANLLFEEDDEILLGILMKYQLQGRYPDYNPTVPDKAKIVDYLMKTEKLLKWLEVKL
ncbi:MAG: HEPN domain-containing protein [Bacteroidia bacterium]|nr:HEPN domain-containing protein [Bacteroidia bacterium]